MFVESWLSCSDVIRQASLFGIELEDFFETLKNPDRFQVRRFAPGHWRLQCRTASDIPKSFGWTFTMDDIPKFDGWSLFFQLNIVILYYVHILGGGTPFSDKTISRQKFRDTVHLRVTHQPIAHPYSTLINDMILVHPVPFMPHFQQHLAISTTVGIECMDWVQVGGFLGSANLWKRDGCWEDFSKALVLIWKFPKSWGYPQIINFNRIVHYKPSILGTYIYGTPYMFLSSFWISSASWSMHWRDAATG